MELNLKTLLENLDKLLEAKGIDSKYIEYSGADMQLDGIVLGIMDIYSINVIERNEKDREVIYKLILLINKEREDLLW